MQQQKKSEQPWPDTVTQRQEQLPSAWGLLNGRNCSYIDPAS